MFDNVAIFLLPKAPHYGTKDHSLHYLVLLKAPPPTLRLPMKMVWLSGLSPVNRNLKLNGAYMPILVPVLQNHGHGGCISY